MEKAKRGAKRPIRWQPILLVLLVTGTMLVMAGSMLLTGLAIHSNYQIRATLTHVSPSETPLSARALHEHFHSATPSPTQAVELHLHYPELTTVTPIANLMLTAEAFKTTLQARATATAFGTCARPAWNEDYRCDPGTHWLLPTHITQNTVYRGIDPQLTRLQGSTRTLFTVKAGAVLRLENVTVSNSGWLSFHVEKGGRLELKNCILDGASNVETYSGNVPFYGGILWNAGTIDIDNCVLTGYASRGSLAALVNTVTGSAFIRQSQFTANNGGSPSITGRAALLNYGLLKLENSGFYRNRVSDGNPVMANEAGGIATLTNVIFNENQIPAGGSSIFNAGDMVIQGVFTLRNNSLDASEIHNTGRLELYGSYFWHPNACSNDGILIDPDKVCS